LRIAKEQVSPYGFLRGIAGANFTTTINGDGTVLISTSTGGSAATFTLPAGTDPASVAAWAELAMETLDTGIDAPIQWNENGSPTVVPSIQQVSNSQRRASYAQFPNCQH
jgi:hypothetical protein